jgi:hypothetical protein
MSARSHGDCWEAVCAHCGKLASLDRRWQLDKPTDAAPHKGDCCDAVSAAGAPALAAWEHTFVLRITTGRVSGFSTSESDFTPHWNRSLGVRVESLKQMKALQAKAGTSDVVVKGDGAERHVPRDIGTRLKHHREVAASLASGQTVFEPRMPDGRPSGVRIDLSEQREAD